MQISSLFSYLLSDVPGVPDPVAIQAIRQSCIEFCVETHAWEEVQDPVSLIDGVSTYDIDVPAGARAVTVKAIYMSGRELRPVSMVELQTLIPNWQSAQGSLPSYYNTTGDLGTVRVYPIPTESGGAQITVRAVYAPTLVTTSVPDQVINRYLEPIMSGALHRMMMAPGKGWSNPQLAVYHKAQFEEGVMRAKNDILHEKTQGSIKVKPVRFGF